MKTVSSNLKTHFGASWFSLVASEKKKNEFISDAHVL